MPDRAIWDSIRLNKIKGGKKCETQPDQFDPDNDYINHELIFYLKRYK